MVASAAFSLLPLLCFRVFLSLTGVLGNPPRAVGRVGVWILQGGLGAVILHSVFSMTFFLPWLLLPSRALCPLSLWKLSLLQSMALWKEALRLKDLTCPQDFCSR